MTNNFSPFKNFCPWDYRYRVTDEGFFRDLEQYASEEAYIRYLLKVEQAIADTLADWGICSREIAEEIKHACEQVTPQEVYEGEREIRHNIRAIVNCVRNKVSAEAKPYVHLFATSNDVMDTATALRLKELCSKILLPELIALEKKLIKLAREHASTIQIGRTHGKHAEPITFGFALAWYVSRLGGRIRMLHQACVNLRGKFSGPVGAHNSIALIYPDDPALFERDVLRKLGLRAADDHVSTQIAQPEFVTDLVYSAISSFSVLANLADDIRHLHRSEIAEVQEQYDVQDVGSSTMPHKVNPKNFEHIKSLWKAFMPRIVTVLMDQISEHQRDLTNSASGRFVIEIFIGLSYAAYRLRQALERIYIDKEKMKQNLELSKDSIVAEPLYILLALKGFPDAYDYTRQLVERAYRTNTSLNVIIEKDERIKPYLAKLTPEQKTILQDPQQYLGDAPQRTEVACRLWELEIQRVEELLQTP